MKANPDPRPKSWVGLAGLVVTTVSIIIATRVLLGRTFLNPPAPITLIGILGGAAAGVAMSLVLGWRASAPPDERATLRVVQWLHVTYFTLGGGLYPLVMSDVVGLSSQWYAALPGAVLTAVVWSELLYIVAALVYLLGGALPADFGFLDVWLDLFWFYLVYGVFLGVVLGLSEAVWLPLIPK